jgi:hypothetical protein
MVRIRKEKTAIGLTVEHRKLEGSDLLSKDLACHIAEQCLKGTVAIVTERPIPLMSVTRKQWLKLIRKIERARSSTLNHEQRKSLSNDILYLENVTFSAKKPLKDPTASVCFATAKKSLLAPPICQTLYITTSTEKHERYMLTSWMPTNGLVVIYE